MFEAGDVPNPQAASTDHHRLIRAFYSDPGYAARIPAAFAAWDVLWGDLGARHYVPRGMLALSRAEGDWSDRSRAALEARGMAYELLEPQDFARRYPMLDPGGVRYSMLTEDGGALMAERILRGLTEWLVARGVVLHTHCPVTLVSETGAIETPKGRFEADRTLLALGVQSATLAPDLDDCHARRVCVLYASPPERWARAWAEAPCWVDLGGEDDLWGMPPMEGLPLKLGFGAHTSPGDPETEWALRSDDIETVLGAYRGRVRDIDAFTLVRPHVNFYLMAPGERFRLHHNGAVLSLSADSGHGFKFGALTGLDVAEAVTTGNLAPVAHRMGGGL